MLYDHRNTARDMYTVSESCTNEGCVAILKPSSLKAEYRNKDNQLFLLEGGFGCSPTAGGNACYGTFCVDGEQCRMERYNFIGIADEKTTKYGLDLLHKVKDRQGT